MERPRRRAKRKPKRYKEYCRGCDAWLVESGKKCPYCGIRAGRKRDKK